MKPATYAQPLKSVGTFLDHNLFHGMVTPSRLDLEEDKLIPTGWYGFGGDGLRFGCTLNHGVQLERTAIFWFPRFTVRQGHVQDIGDSTSPDDIVVIEQVASFFVRVDRHVLLRARDGTASCDLSQETPKLLGIQGVTESEKIREESDLLFGEVIEGGEVSCLDDL
jgi:hypothetical protein